MLAQQRGLRLILHSDYLTSASCLQSDWSHNPALHFCKSISFSVPSHLQYSALPTDRFFIFSTLPTNLLANYLFFSHFLYASACFFLSFQTALWSLRMPLQRSKHSNLQLDISKIAVSFPLLSSSNYRFPGCQHLGIIFCDRSGPPLAFPSPWREPNTEAFLFSSKEKLLTW